jgi:hypothetical protein
MIISSRDRSWSYTSCCRFRVPWCRITISECYHWKSWYLESAGVSQNCISYLGLPRSSANLFRDEFNNSLKVENTFCHGSFLDIHQTNALLCITMHYYAVWSHSPLNFNPRMARFPRIIWTLIDTCSVDLDDRHIQRLNLWCPCLVDNYWYDIMTIIAECYQRNLELFFEPHKWKVWYYLYQEDKHNIAKTNFLPMFSTHRIIPFQN